MSNGGKIGLSKSLSKLFIKIFIDKEKIEIDKRVENLIRYISFPVLIHYERDARFNKQLFSYKHLFRRLIIDKKKIKKEEINKKLAKNSIFKLLLVDDPKDESRDYLTININNKNKLSVGEYIFSYRKKEGRKNIKERKEKKEIELHFKNLLEDANVIEIIDNHLLSLNNKKEEWDIIYNFLINIISKKIEVIVIVTDPKNKSLNRKNEFRQYFSNKKIKVIFKEQQEYHDRYINIYSYKKDKKNKKEEYEINNEEKQEFYNEIKEREIEETTIYIKGKLEKKLQIIMTGGFYHLLINKKDTSYILRTIF